MIEPISRLMTVFMLVGTFGLTPKTSSAGDSPFPPQLEMRVPFAPTAFPGRGGIFVCYELYLTNFSSSPINLRRIDVFVADARSSKTVASFEGPELRRIERPLLQSPSNANPGQPEQLEAGGTTIVFMWLSFKSGVEVPTRLQHRILVGDTAIEGASVGTRSTRLQKLAPPVEGIWTASEGPGNSLENHHRTGILALNGHNSISRRYAIDWMQIDWRDDAIPRDKRAFRAYGQAVFAVANARVVFARDGQPDNIPGPPDETFHTAVPITLETAGGNTVVLDLGDGQYAWYFHLEPGSVLVKAGQRVKRGEPLAKIGLSGDANIPHLHFEVTTSPHILAGEGVPYVIESFELQGGEGSENVRRNEMPMDGMTVLFRK